MKNKLATTMKGNTSNNRRGCRSKPKLVYPKVVPYVITTKRASTSLSQSLQILYVQVFILVVTSRYCMSPCHSSQIHDMSKAFRGWLNGDQNQNLHMFPNPINNNSNNNKFPLTFIPNVLSLRGGSNEEEEKNPTSENTSHNNTDDEDSPKYFGLIHSVFQMNMDAKEELTTGTDTGTYIDTPGDDTNGEYEYDTESDSDSESSKDEEPSSSPPPLCGKDNSNDDNYDIENVNKNEEEQVSPSSSSTLDTTPKVSTASSRLIIDMEEEDMSDADADADIDTVSSSESDDDVEQEGETEDNTDEVVNDREVISPETEEESETTEETEEDEDDNITNEEEIAESASLMIDQEAKEEVEEVEEDDKGEEIMTVPLKDEEQEEVEQDEQGENLPSIHEIVQEEWDMIPDTEVEDELDEIKSAQRRKEEEEREQRRQLERERIRILQEEKEQRQIERQRRRKEREKRRQERELKRQKKRDEEKKKRQEEMMMKSRENREKDSNEKDNEKDNMRQVVVREVPAASALPPIPPPSFVSSGWWTTIDKISSLGLSETNDDLKVSKKLHSIRKKAAQLTGLHGLISGKGRGEYAGVYDTKDAELNEEDLGKIRQRLAAIEMARKKVAATDEPIEQVGVRVGRWRRLFGRGRRNLDQNVTEENEVLRKSEGDEMEEAKDSPTMKSIPSISTEPSTSERIKLEELEVEERNRSERVKEIDSQIKEGQKRILELQCEKDEIQRRPNPLFNYTTSSQKPRKNNTETHSYASDRTFNFPSDNLIKEYIDELQSNGRLQKMNHTQLWRSDSENENDEDDEEIIGDDLLTPSGDVRKLYENRDNYRNINNNENNARRTHNNHHRRNGANGGSWLLRQSLGMGGTLGEKIGVAIEDVAYKAVSKVMMSIFARLLSSLHGVSVMKHSDIRLYVESSPDLPPVQKAIYSASSDDYAREAIGKAIRRGSKKKRKRRHKAYHYGSHTGDDAFVQRDAVVETLISHCQISAPLLKLFPSEWQRALLGNIITLIAAIVSDFCEGVQFQILGHQLSFAFKPITEADMIQHIGVGGFRFNHRRAKPEEFEAAVRATAEDMSKSLSFLDRWHQRALGGDLLRAQIGNLIARVVLTLVDEVLHSARMDLWSAQVGGPRIVAGLEYRNENI